MKASELEEKSYRYRNRRQATLRLATRKRFGGFHSSVKSRARQIARRLANIYEIDYDTHRGSEGTNTT